MFVFFSFACSEERLLCGPGSPVRGPGCEAQHRRQGHTLQHQRRRGVHRALQVTRYQQQRPQVRRCTLHSATWSPEGRHGTLLRHLHATSARLEDAGRAETRVW